jgi:hypothetical protein
LATVAAWNPGGAGNTSLLSRPGVFHLGVTEILAALTQSAKERRDVAELRLLRGLLALEIGDFSAAANHFRGSLTILPPILPITLDFPDRPIAQRYLRLLEMK